MDALVRRWVGGEVRGGASGCSGDAAAVSSFNLAAVEIGSVLREVMELVRTHRVQVDPSFTSLVTSIIIVEGIGRQLVPDLNLFALAMPMVLKAKPEYRRQIATRVGAAVLASPYTHTQGSGMSMSMHKRSN